VNRHSSGDRASRRFFARAQSTYPYEKKATKNSIVASHRTIRMSNLQAVAIPCIVRRNPEVRSPSAVMGKLEPLTSATQLEGAGPSQPRM